MQELESLGESEVTSETIGESVMAHLRELDDVAYVRFASVYRNFREAKDFETALAELPARTSRRRQRERSSAQAACGEVVRSLMNVELSLRRRAKRRLFGTIIRVGAADERDVSSRASSS